MSDDARRIPVAPAAPDAPADGAEHVAASGAEQSETPPAVPGGRRPLGDDAEPAPAGRISGWIAAIPLRARLVAITASLLAAGLIATGLLARGVVGGYLVDQVDAQLEQQAPALASAVVDSVLNYGAAKTILPSDYYIEYRWANGAERPLYDERAVETYGTPVMPDLTYEETVEGQHHPFTVRASEGSDEATRWRVYPLLMTDATDTIVPQSAFVALPLGRIDATLAFFSRTLVLAGLGIVLFGLGLAWFMIDRSLRQLREIETAAASIAAGDLSQRVPAPPSSTEVGSLAESLNTMLAQIETAFSAREASETRMRQFVSDASHELRTPLASIRGYGELYRMGALNGPDGPDSERVSDTMGRIEDSARRMGTLVNDLLVLARLDEGRPIARAPVDVAVLARESAQDLHALDPSREVRVMSLSGADDTSGASSAVVGPVLVEGDDDRLRQVLTNLIGNVARHTPAGSPAEIVVGRGPEGDVVVEVRDHGPGVTGEHAERMFERFYRADSSRNRESGGSGLGLAIVSAIVEAHGGRVEDATTDGGGLTVRITLPGLTP